jgi:hypothetical protein
MCAELLGGQLEGHGCFDWRCDLYENKTVGDTESLQVEVLNSVT